MKIKIIYFSHQGNGFGRNRQQSTFKTTHLIQLSSLQFLYPFQAMITHLRHVRRFCSKSSSLDPGIRIYSCRTREKVPLQLPSACWVTSFYTCGPTVYDSAHIGHASCYVRLDIVQRILKDHFRMNLVTAMNITDIDDKIIKRANESGQPWMDVARHYEQEFWSDLKRLNVRSPDVKLRVTDHIPAITAFIQRLLVLWLCVQVFGRLRLL